MRRDSDLEETHESERQKILGHPGYQIGTTERPSGHNLGTSPKAKSKKSSGRNLGTKIPLWDTILGQYP